ncbi:MAG TPA: peptide deformylase [Spirillospora sp.]|nr:peptide deformylase [Spirillospora sp.]
MAVRKILLYPQDEAALRQKSNEVRRGDPQLQSLIQDLKDTLATQEGSGLAAPQIGVHKRVALVVFGQDEGELQPPLAIINPRIIQQGPLTRGFDGCLSVPGLYTWDTLRPQWLVFTARDEHWRKIQMRVEGADARGVSHEVDHLDGVLFLDHLDADSKLYIRQQDSEGMRLSLE